MYDYDNDYDHWNGKLKRFGSEELKLGKLQINLKSNLSNDFYECSAMFTLTFIL